MGAPRFVLAIDTCTRRASIALRDAHALRGERAWESDRHHSAAVAAHLRDMCAECGCSPADIDGVAVALGPGSFTGVRCGLAIAKGMSVSNGVAVAGFSAFDVLIAAQPFAPADERPIFALVEAGRKRVALRRYPGPGPGRASFEVIPLEAIASQIPVGGYVCGDLPEGILFGPGVTVATPALNLRRAGVLADLGWQRLAAGAPDDVHGLAPIYPPAG